MFLLTFSRAHLFKQSKINKKNFFWIVYIKPIKVTLYLEMKQFLIDKLLCYQYKMVTAHNVLTTGVIKQKNVHFKIRTLDFEKNFN